VLASPDAELIDLARAQCSHPPDAVMIREAISGHDEEVTRLVVGLIRDNVCGVGAVPEGAYSAPGSLALPLRDSVVDLSTTDFSSSRLRLLQLAGWLRLRPKVQRLVVSATPLSGQGIALLRSALREGLLQDLKHLETTDTDDDLSALAREVQQGAPQLLSSRPTLDSWMARERQARVSVSSPNMQPDSVSERQMQLAFMKQRVFSAFSVFGRRRKQRALADADGLEVVETDYRSRCGSKAPFDGGAVELQGQSARVSLSVAGQGGGRSGRASVTSRQRHSSEV
jgi:hypothetical protein